MRAIHELKREEEKEEDDITQRRTHSSPVVLDNIFAIQLNDYFHKLCTDLNYIAPVDVVIGSEVLEIPERLVWKSLSNITQTVTDPDGIRFWVWKEHAEILTPILSHIWDLPLHTHTWPMSWKRSNINPIPKVDIPKKIWLPWYKYHPGYNQGFWKSCL